MVSFVVATNEAHFLPMSTAPTDAAFDALPEGTLDALLADIPALTEILTYHVVPAMALSTGLVDGPVDTVEGDPVYIETHDGVMVNDANVETADVLASNGVIHVIDKVLIPGTFNATDDHEDDVPTEGVTPTASPDTSSAFSVSTSPFMFAIAGAATALFN
jgi:hypothetical protein